MRRGRVQREAEVVEDGIAAGQERSGKLETTLHRVQPGKMTTYRCLRLRIPAYFAMELLAAIDALGDGRRADPERGGDPREDLGVLMHVPGASRVCSRLFPGLGGRRRACFVPVQPRLEPSGSAEAAVIVVSLEDGDNAFHQPCGFFCSSFRNPEKLQELLLDEHAGLRALVMCVARQPRSL